ncbi:DnaJ family domain-containing protein [Aspergillus glaucus CBS 516.65]|uniref:DnaJ homologue subfamily C member 28 conserved domain-containing protein n=1 Tax=Aspergillus glaucus CBS 516.65 TaxID=1160497 RepID=A0A1L9VRI1_ASPGL|nr:hypothetical protein ASPGLDRAFT_64787 [Aspergillus glaucus CBS 516.65]OJJ86523.1 hypothetical protein ASPGLDRAFT_64787 [Aspergillus glaucus CBS 516.65]
MARRLSEMTEDALLEGGRSARKNIQEAGFSEDLKAKLEERLAGSTFKNEYAAAHSIVDMPESAGQGTQDIAGSTPWSGAEELPDITLRMLDDAKPKPIRTPYKIPQPNPVDLRISPKRKVSPGVRIAEAKERTAIFNLSQSPGLTDKERESIREELRERFTPGARPMPVSVQGFASLANERIEDAIARGQFKNIKRGKGINTEIDHNANNAFMDTTEYLMNKMIQRQEIVPPWIEKQQELAKEVDRFRQRLRADWRRHAARMIASEGGPLEEQMRRARTHAAAEARLAERARIENSFQEDSSEPATESTTEASSSTPETQPEKSDENLPHLPPLRDHNYLSIERPYHEVTVKNLNALARSYNLQAPPVAQKPYINLDRELSSCFADVAPSLADEIKRRATEKAHGPSTMVHQKTSSVMDSLSTTQASHVYDEDQSKGYGFREFWRDLFSKKDR